MRSLVSLGSTSMFEFPGPPRWPDARNRLPSKSMFLPLTSARLCEATRVKRQFVTLEFSAKWPVDDVPPNCIPIERVPFTQTLSTVQFEQLPREIAWGAELKPGLAPFTCRSRINRPESGVPF